MKYIIELGEEANMVQAINVTQNGTVYVDAKYVTELEELNSDYINENFGDLQDTAYQKGFEKGKDVRIKGCEGCMYQDTTIEHNPCNLCCNAFLNRWTAKDDKIEVGDEVKHDRGWTAVVTQVDESGLSCVDKFGAVASYSDISRFSKTDRHFDIDKILEGLRYDD